MKAMTKTSVSAVLTSFLMCALLLSTFSARADQELFELGIDSETAMADSVAEVEEAKAARERVEQERVKHQSEMQRLNEEIRQAKDTAAAALKERTQNEREIARLQKEQVQANAQFQKAKRSEQKSQQVLKVTADKLSRVQRARDAVVQKKEAAVARMNERQEQAKELVAKAQKAQEDYRIAQLQYRKALEREKAQRLALAKKKELMRKRIAEARAKTERLKLNTKKVELGRAG